MHALSANDAKTHFGELLIKAQRSPVQINKNGKPVAVVMSTEDYQTMESLKLQLLQARAMQAKADIGQNNLIDGEQFFGELEAGKFD